MTESSSERDHDPNRQVMELCVNDVAGYAGHFIDNFEVTPDAGLHELDSLDMFMGMAPDLLWLLSSNQHIQPDLMRRLQDFFAYPPKALGINNTFGVMVHGESHGHEVLAAQLYDVLDKEARNLDGFERAESSYLIQWRLNRLCEYAQICCARGMRPKLIDTTCSRDDRKWVACMQYYDAAIAKAGTEDREVLLGQAEMLALDVVMNDFSASFVAVAGVDAFKRLRDPQTRDIFMERYLQLIETLPLSSAKYNILNQMGAVQIAHPEPPNTAHMEALEEIITAARARLPQSSRPIERLNELRWDVALATYQGMSVDGVIGRVDLHIANEFWLAESLDRRQDDISANAFASPEIIQAFANQALTELGVYATLRGDFEAASVFARRLQGAGQAVDLGDFSKIVGNVARLEDLYWFRPNDLTRSIWPHYGHYYDILEAAMGDDLDLCQERAAAFTAVLCDEQGLDPETQGFMNATLKNLLEHIGRCTSEEFAVELARTMLATSRIDDQTAVRLEPLSDLLVAHGDSHEIAWLYRAASSFLPGIKEQALVRLATAIQRAA